MVVIFNRYLLLNNLVKWHQYQGHPHPQFLLAESSRLSAHELKKSIQPGKTKIKLTKTSTCIKVNTLYNMGMFCVSILHILVN